MIPIDLHVHSTYSDGLLSPEALCALAQRKHLDVLALCDHDTLNGLKPMGEAAEKANRNGKLPLTVLPAVELSTGNDGRTHLLGYGVNPHAPALLAALRELRHTRRLRSAQMVEALGRLGIVIPPDLLPPADAAGMPVGRPHIARALIRAGVVQTIAQAFEQYLGEGRPAYVPLNHMTSAQAVTILRNAGAVPVLAHPSRTGLSPETLEALVEALQAAGLEGIEVFHPSASRCEIRQLEAMARRRGLLVTGGSDFHGDRDARAKLGGLPAGWHTWKADLDALNGAIEAAAVPEAAVAVIS